VSQENLRIVREAFGRFETTDPDFSHWHQDVVVIPPEGWPEGGEVRGLDAWRRQIERLRDSWEAARIEIDEMEAIGDERVVTIFRYVTRGRDGALEFDTTMGSIHTFRDHKIVRAEFFRSADDVLEAARHGR
jgi:ketosteroid isomerase-like protein